MTEHRILLCNDKYELTYCDDEDTKRPIDISYCGEDFQILDKDQIIKYLAKEFLDLKDRSEKVEEELFEFYLKTLFYGRNKRDEIMDDLEKFCSNLFYDRGISDYVWL